MGGAGGSLGLWMKEMGEGECEHGNRGSST